MAGVVRGRFRKPRWRILRTYQRTADKEYKCELCPDPIHPGDLYHAEVKVWETRDYPGSNELKVLRYHDDCPDKDPDRHHRDEIDEIEDKMVHDSEEQAEPETDGNVDEMTA